MEFEQILCEVGDRIATVTLNRPSGKFISVTFGPNGSGTATPGVDYAFPSFGIVAFGPDLTGVGPITRTFTWYHRWKEKDGYSSSRSGSRSLKKPT